jgi:hypothetical protein
VVVVRVFFVMGVRHGGDSTANQLIHPSAWNRNSRKFTSLAGSCIDPPLRAARML